MVENARVEMSLNLFELSAVLELELEPEEFELELELEDDPEYAPVGLTGFIRTV